MSFLSPSGGRDYARLLASPAALLPSPLAHGLFSPGADATQVVKDGRLSFDVLLQEPQEGEEGGAAALEGLVAPQLKATRSASQLEFFAVADPERPKAAPAGAAGQQQQQQEQLAALTERVVSQTVAAKVAEAQELVAGVAAKCGLAADYSKAEETIKAVWADHGRASRANSTADALPAAAAKQQQQQPQLTGGADELTLGGTKGTSGATSGDEEAGPQATSSLKAAPPAARDEGAGLKRPLGSQPSFTFQVPAAPGGFAGAADNDNDVAAKKRRVQYDRMRELEAAVQRERLMGDALKQSLRQAEAQHDAATLENEQLWSALLHIHASLRAAHSALLRQQVALHAAAVAAALPPPPPVPANAPAPSPGTMLGGLFSPDADELAAACGMFVSPAKAANAHAAANKPRKLFLDEEAGKGAEGGRPSLCDPQLALLPAELQSPALWVQAAT